MPVVVCDLRGLGGDLMAEVSRLFTRNLRRSCRLCKPRAPLVSPLASRRVQTALDINRRRDDGSPQPLHHPFALHRLFRVMNSSKFVTSEDGTKIWTDAVGDPSKPSVVFIPGASSSVLVFDKQFEDPELEKNLHLVHHLPPVRGHLLTLARRFVMTLADRV